LSFEGRWYVASYPPKSVRAKQHHCLPHFAAALAWVRKIKATPTTDILRVLPPADATAEQLLYLRENGATLV
jgi:hypothetical protein